MSTNPPRFDSVVKQLLNNGRANGRKITKALAHFLAQTVYNGQTRLFFSESEIKEEDEKEMVKKLLALLEDEGNIKYKTVRMQINYEASCLAFDNSLQEQQNNIASESSRLIDAVLEVKGGGTNNYDQLTLLYQKIFSFLLYKNSSLIQKGQGDNDDVESMEREVAAALESVIPRAALSPFMMLNNAEKVTQLSELSNLVLGIRLFNKEIGKGGNSLEGVKVLFDRLQPSLIDEIKENLQQAASITNEYESYILYVIENNIKDPNLEVLKNELIFIRQHIALVINLLEKTENSMNGLEQYQGRYLKEVEDLKQLLGSKSSAPKEQVYPKFSTLANSYLMLMEESQAAGDKKFLFELLLDAVKEAKFSLTESQIATANRFMDYLENQRNTSDEQIVRYENKNGVHFIEAKNTPEFFQTHLDFSGFSIVSLVKYDGLLVSGKHQYGVFKYEDLMLVFYSHDEIRKFIERPDYYLTELYSLCRKYPALIFLLKVEDYFRSKGLKLLEVSEDTKDATKVQLDKSCDTPVHFIGKYFDHSYFWNEWELRKKAIQMANIRNMTTKGSQTSDSIFKVHNETQVWLKRDNATMTGIDNGNNPIRPRNYITELRDKTVQ